MFWDLVEDIRDGINRRFKARLKYELLFSKLYPGRWYLRALFFTTGMATVVFTVVQIIGVLSLTESQATTLGGYIALWNIALLYIPSAVVLLLLSAWLRLRTEIVIIGVNKNHARHLVITMMERLIKARQKN